MNFTCMDVVRICQTQPWSQSSQDTFPFLLITIQIWDWVDLIYTTGREKKRMGEGRGRKKEHKVFILLIPFLFGLFQLTKCHQSHLFYYNQPNSSLWLNYYHLNIYNMVLLAIHLFMRTLIDSHCCEYCQNQLTAGFSLESKLSLDVTQKWVW